MLTYGHTEPVQVYFDDLDAMGLLHNSRYTVLMERAMAGFWGPRGWSHDPARSKLKDVLLVVREVKVTYHVPITGTSAPLVHIWIDRIGRSSIVYGFRITSADRSVTHAEGHRVNVNLDPVTLRPAEISDETRAIAAELVRPTEPADLAELAQAG